MEQQIPPAVPTVFTQLRSSLWWSVSIFLWAATTCSLGRGSHPGKSTVFSACHLWGFPAEEGKIQRSQKAWLHWESNQIEAWASQARDNQSQCDSTDNQMGHMRWTSLFCSHKPPPIHTSLQGEEHLQVGLES